MLCPSYYAKPGAELYGVVNEKGKIDYLETTIEINDTFINIANKGRHPEKRFRFAGTCAKSGCNQWSHQQNGCGLIDKVIDYVNNPINSSLQHCAIRHSCRWYEQKHALACAQCTDLVRNLESEAISNRSLKQY